jgi:hypothetical protein
VTLELIEREVEYEMEEKPKPIQHEILPDLVELCLDECNENDRLSHEVASLKMENSELEYQLSESEDKIKSLEHLLSLKNAGNSPEL